MNKGGDIPERAYPPGVILPEIRRGMLAREDEKKSESIHERLMAAPPRLA